MAGITKNEELIKQFIRYLYEALPKAKGKPHNLQLLVEDTIKYMPQASDRQMYKIVFPFLVYNYEIQANYIVKTAIIRPLIANNFALFTTINPYSRVLLNYGEEFMLKFDDNFGMEQEILQYYGVPEASQLKLPQRFSLAYKFERECKELLKMTLKNNSNETNLMINTLALYIYNKIFNQEIIQTSIDKLKLKCTEENLDKLNFLQLQMLMRCIKSIHLLRYDWKSRLNYVEFEDQLMTYFKKRLLAYKSEPYLYYHEKHHLEQGDFIIECLNEMKIEFKNHLFLENAYEFVDFYLPKENSIINITRTMNYYPYTKKLNNLQRTITFSLKQSGFKVANLSQDFVEQNMNPESKSYLKRKLLEIIHENEKPGNIKSNKQYR